MIRGPTGSGPGSSSAREWFDGYVQAVSEAALETRGPETGENAPAAAIEETYEFGGPNITGTIETISIGDAVVIGLQLESLEDGDGG